MVPVPSFEKKGALLSFVPPFLVLGPPGAFPEMPTQTSASVRPKLRWGFLRGLPERQANGGRNDPSSFPHLEYFSESFIHFVSHDLLKWLNSVSLFFSIFQNVKKIKVNVCRRPP